jgi:magnesium transporter
MEEEGMENQAEKIRLLSDTIGRLHRRAAIKSLQKVISKTHAADLALVLRSLPESEVTPVFLSASYERAAEILTYLTPRLLDILFSEAPRDSILAVLDKVPPDELTDLIAQLEPTLAESLMASMAGADKKEIENLLQYAPDTAGGIMTPDFFALPDDTPVGKAIDTIHDLSDVEMVFYLYVVDSEGRLIGVVSLRQLLIAKPEKILREIMNARIIKVYTSAHQEEVAKLADKYRILAVPVVDEHEVLVGMVTVDDIIEVIQEETTKDILKMAGTDESEILAHSPLKIARIRLPWLFAAFGGGLAATGIIHLFESVLTQLLALSAFLPVVMGMAGNVGVQTSTVAVRGLATGQLNIGHTVAAIYKEARVGLLLGVFYGMILGLFGWWAFGSISLGEIVGVTILFNMTGAAILAIVLPLFFHRIGADPAIATGPFVTTAIDILGVANYFGIAILFVNIV